MQVSRETCNEQEYDERKLNRYDRIACLHAALR